MGLLYKGGKELPVWFATASCRGIDGKLDLFVTIAQDTEANRKSRETLDEWLKQLTRKYRFESFLTLVTGRIDQSLNLYEVLENTAEAVRRSLDVVGYVSMIHKECH